MAQFEVNDELDKTELQGEEGKCPYCGSENIDFHGPDVQDGYIFYDCNCDDCENSYQEWYHLTFDTMHGYPLKDTPIRSEYIDGVCPDCNEDIPTDMVDGGECENCGHVFYEPKNEEE